MTEQLGVQSRTFRLMETTIDELHAAIKSEQTTCVEIVQHYLDRVIAYNGVASMLVTEDGAPVPEAPGVVRGRGALRFPTETIKVSTILPDLDSIRLSESVSITVEGDVSDLLLFDWLNELLYIYEVRHLLLCQFEVEFGPSGLVATAQGEPIDPARHALDHEVKAITYHGLKLEQQDGRWLAEVIVDI